MQSPDHRPAAPPPAALAVKRSPSTGSPMHLVAGDPTRYTFRNVALTASGFLWECPDTQQRYSTPEQVNALLAQVHRQWREHLGIGRVALQQRRLALGLSAAQASALLGFGINQYSTYEQTDRVPSRSNAVLLQLLMTNQGITALVEAEATGKALKPAARRRLRQFVAGLAPEAPSNQPAITATGANVAGGSSSEQPPRERKQAVCHEAPEQVQASRELQAKQQAPASIAGDYADAMVSSVGDYSYAMAA